MNGTWSCSYSTIENILLVHATQIAGMTNRVRSWIVIDRGRFGDWGVLMDKSSLDEHSIAISEKEAKIFLRPSIDHDIA